MSQNDKKVWDQLWAEEDETTSLKTISHILDQIKYSYLKKLLPVQGRALEVGCGSARLSYFMAKNNYSVYGLDYSLNALKIAERNFNLHSLNGDFVIGDAFKLPFEDNAFDIVMSTGLLEHSFSKLEIKKC